MNVSENLSHITLTLNVVLMDKTQRIVDPLLQIPLSARAELSTLLPSALPTRSEPWNRTDSQSQPRPLEVRHRPQLPELSHWQKTCQRWPQNVQLDLKLPAWRV